MLKSLYTLSEQYKNRKLIIYGVNRSSINTFARLALNYQVDIFGFWDVTNRFTGDYLVNRQIINIDQILKMNDVLVIVPKVQAKQEVRKLLGKDADVFYADEILSLNQTLQDKKIYIYGIGNRGAVIYDSLLNQGIKIEGVCVTEPGRTERWCGREVLSIRQIKQGDNYAIILATDIEKSQNGMLEQLEGSNIEKYVSYFMPIHFITEGNFFQVINFALLKHKNIMLYGQKSEYTLYLEEVLERYQISITHRICNEDIYDLEYEDIDNTCVLIAEDNELKMEWVCKTLDSMGYGLERWDYAATGPYTLKAADRIIGKSDVLIGDSIVEVEKYPGYVVYGDAEQAKIRIMVLGGSTSTDGVYRTVSWVRFFYEKLLAKGYSLVIYNGAVCGHGIVDEFLHMIRDIKPLKIDYVINFSGVCNTFQKKVANQFNIRAAEFALEKNSNQISGIESDETIYDFWCRVSRLMELVAKFHGAKTYSFLQPMSAAKDKLDLAETYMFDYTDHTEYMRQFKERALAERNKFYIDLVSLLEDREEMYIDSCHYSSEANKLIAERVFETVWQEIEITYRNRID